MIVMQMCPKILVSSWCVATTLTLHGSAGLTPQSVEKIRLLSKSSLYMLRNCLPICVSLNILKKKYNSSIEAILYHEKANIIFNNSPFRCHGKDGRRETLKQIGTSKWPECSSRMRNDDYDRILQVHALLRIRKAGAWHCQLLTK